MTALVSRKELPFNVEMASSTVDGGAIDLGVDDAMAAREYLARPAVAKQLTQAGSTPVRVRQSPAMVPLSGRWDDTSAFHAGAAPTSSAAPASRTTAAPSRGPATAAAP
ncbi:hypothetical protein [Streptomyces fradiae]|uniref:hypothetical protein n=1 Tax=Streptomyces fradiae TaxID=1906 RepID=UPI00351726D8